MNNAPADTPKSGGHEASWTLEKAVPTHVRDLSTPERCFMVAFVGFFSLGVLNTMGAALGSVVPFVTPSGFSAVAIYVPLCAYWISRIREHKPLRLMPFVVLYLAFLSFVLLSLAVHPEYAAVMLDRTFTGNLHTALLSPLAPLVAFLIIVTAPSTSVILLGLQLAAYLTFAGNIVRFVQATTRGYWVQIDSLGREFEASYDLGFGYSVLFSIVVFAFLGLSGRRPFFHLMCVALGMVMILLGGSRAPIGFAVLATILFAVYFHRKLILRTPGRMAASMSVAIGLTLAYVYLDRLLVAAQAFLVSMNFESRSLERVIDGTFAEDQARDTLQDMSAQLVESGGLFGHGLYGDRYYLSDRFRWGYPHNIVDEFQITFGWLGGGLLLTVVVVLVVTALVVSRGTTDRDLVVLLLPLTFQLWVSLSYLLAPWFWALLGASWLALISRRSRGVRLPAPPKGVRHNSIS